MPGFGPAAEVLLFRQKDPKPLTPRPVTSEWADASHGRAGQLAALKQGQPRDEGVRPERRAAGGGQDEVGNRGHREVGSAFHSLDWFVVMPTLFSISPSYPRRWVSRMGMLKKAASCVLATLPCSRTVSTFRASNWLRPFLRHSSGQDWMTFLIIPASC